MPTRNELISSEPHTHPGYAGSSHESEDFGSSTSDVNEIQIMEDVISTNGNDRVCEISNEGRVNSRRETFMEMLRDARGGLESERVGLESEQEPLLEYECAFGIPDELDPNLTSFPNEATLCSDNESVDEGMDPNDTSESESESEESGGGDRIFQSVIDSLHERVEASAEIYRDEQLREMTTNGWNVAPENRIIEMNDGSDVELMYSGYRGPSASVLRSGSSALGLFYYFLPKQLWIHIASETNRYWRQTFDARVEEEYSRQASQPRPLTRLQVVSKLNNFRLVQPHEIVQMIGLMIARMLCPQKHLHAHWSTKQSGAVPRGTFGSVMSRKRFSDILRFLHFSNNDAPDARRDRAWKIRPILQTLEKTFKAGYVLGAQVALDEAMLPTRNRHNPTRTYLKNKPHKWGTKCVMTCCAISGYCKR